jgi:phage shock protein A
MTASVKEIAQQKEKAWAEREKLLQSAEKELADLRQLQLGMDARIKVEVDKHVAIATNALKKDLTSGFVLEKKDLEQRIALESQSAAALAVQNATLEKRIGQLETELIAARESVKEMALAAFKEAGSSKALAEVTSFSARENNSPTRSRS